MTVLCTFPLTYAIYGDIIHIYIIHNIHLVYMGDMPLHFTVYICLTLSLLRRIDAILVKLEPDCVK